MPSISTMQLQVLSNLFMEKEKELKQAVGDLQLNDVKEDSNFKKTVQQIKKQILLQPVTIGEPKITGNQQTTRQVPPNYQNLWGGAQNINVITVEFPCAGSEELFSYRTGESLTIARVYQPSYKSISVEVQLLELNKEQALTKAREEMTTTFELIKQNNPVIERWSAQMEPQVEAALEKKRKELFDFYS